MDTLTYLLAMYLGGGATLLFISINLGALGAMLEEDHLVDIAVWMCLISPVWPALLPASFIYLAIRGR